MERLLQTLSSTQLCVWCKLKMRCLKNVRDVCTQRVMTLSICFALPVILLIIVLQPQFIHQPVATQQLPSGTSEEDNTTTNESNNNNSNTKPNISSPKSTDSSTGTNNKNPNTITSTKQNTNINSKTDYPKFLETSENKILLQEIADICNGKYLDEKLDNFHFPFEKYKLHNSSDVFLYERINSVESEYLSSDGSYYDYSPRAHTRYFDYFNKLDHKSRKANSLLMDISFVDYNKHYIYFGVPKVGSSKVKSLFYYYSTNIHDDTREVHMRIRRDVLDDATYRKNNISFINLIRNREQFENLIFFLDDKKNGKPQWGIDLKQINGQETRKTSEQTYFKFVFLRDPLKRLLSAFLDRCLIEDWKGNVCEWTKQEKNERETKEKRKLDKKELFNMVVDVLHETIVKKKVYFGIDRHFHLQIFECQMFEYITYFDIIAIYDKVRFVDNLKYILRKIVSRNENFDQQGGNGDGDKLVDMKVIEKDYFDNGWGVYGNESLFGQGFHINTMNNNDELNLLKQYFTKQNAMKALEIYQYDYMMLPLEKPWWITQLPD